MKTGKTYIRLVALTIFLLVATESIIISQGTDSRQRYTKEGKLYAGILITPFTSNISNDGFPSSAKINNKGGTSFGFTLEGGYFFSKMAGISIGAGMGSYSAALSLDSCSIKFSSSDPDGEAYEMRIKGKSITEEQQISFLSIPVCLILRIPAGSKLGFFMKAGLSFNLPLKKTYEGKGTFTYDGYYATYPVLLHDIPNYFPSNVSTNSTGDLELKSFSQALIASGGASYQLNESIQLSLGLHFNRSLGSISAYGAGSDYKLTSKPNEMNSIMGGTSGAGVQGLGVSLGVKYYLR
jgi:hypothetical protein